MFARGLQHTGIDVRNTSGRDEGLLVIILWFISAAQGVVHRSVISARVRVQVNVCASFVWRENDLTSIANFDLHFTLNSPRTRTL